MLPKKSFLYCRRRLATGMLRVKRIGKRQRQLASSQYESDQITERNVSNRRNEPVFSNFRNFDVTGGPHRHKRQSFASGRRWREPPPTDAPSTAPAYSRCTSRPGYSTYAVLYAHLGATILLNSLTN